ncbi:AAA family ATPase [Spirosoma linguale]|uniref:ATP-binding protein n=1 Tax=Spirosoma linguale TaxID=108 RepID=UPI0001A3C368
MQKESYIEASKAANLRLEFVENLISETLDQAKPVDFPKLLHTLGVPGSGKSTFVNGLNSVNSVVVSFDRVMEALPQYQHDLITSGKEVAFNNWEGPARAIGYEILERAVDSKRNVIVDHSGARKDHLEFLKQAKQENYQIEVVLCETPSNEAQKRVLKREVEGGRHVPSDYIPQRQTVLNTLISGYREVADIFTIVKPNQEPKSIFQHRPS